MDNQQSDQHLMKRLADGDDSALGDLMKRWESRLLCYVDRMCGYLQRTEDICQEVWTRLFLSRRRYDPARPVATFLFAIATNCCRTEISRGYKRRSSLPWDFSRDVGQAAAYPPGLANLVRAEQLSALYREIYRLPEMQRAVVLLHLLLDGSYEAVAQTLVISRATARSHMSHAVNALRARLDRMTSEPCPAPAPEVKHD